MASLYGKGKWGKNLYCSDAEPPPLWVPTTPLPPVSWDQTEPCPLPVWASSELCPPVDWVDNG